MSERAKYIYGIINSNNETFFGPYGIPACELVYSVSYQDISAVVSDSEIFDCAHMLKNELARLLLSHQRVLEKVMGLEYTIIPMRLTTFAADETEVKDILRKGYSLIKDIFAKVNNKIEIDLTATWNDFASILKEVAEEGEIKALKARLSVNPKSITIDDQMKVGAMVKDLLDKKRDAFALQIKTYLTGISQDIRTHQLMDDKMAANFAFLLDKFAQNDFYKKVEELNLRFGEKLNFKCVGPLPPYSFYTLDIKKMEYKDLDWARNKLGLLKDVATKDEVRKAYQSLAFSTHPDKNPNMPGSELEFNKVTKAYKILEDYCQAVKQTLNQSFCSGTGQAGQEENLYFNEEEFKKNAVVVKVRD